MKEVLQSLVAFLRSRKDEIVTDRKVLVEVYDPTYGLQDPSTETIEVVDFDRLCAAIDEFARTFK